MAHYILKWRGGAAADKGTADEAETRIWLVGPFASEDAAAEWGVKDQDADGDDPRWQAVTLNDQVARRDSYSLPIVKAL